MAEPNQQNVIVGPIVLYVAPYGTAFPSLVAKPTASSWTTAGFSLVGYTADGAELTITPAKKDFTPDETLTPIKSIPTGLTGELKVTLMESHLENIQRVTAMSIIANPGTGIKTVSIGSGNALTEWSIGVQGQGVGAVDGMVWTIFRATSVSAVALKKTRKDITQLAATFTLLSDSTRANTLDVAQIIDFSAGS